MTPQTHHAFPVIPVVRSAPRSHISRSTIRRRPKRCVMRTCCVHAEGGCRSSPGWLLRHSSFDMFTDARCAERTTVRPGRGSTAPCTVPTEHSTLFSAGRNSTQHLIAIATVPHTARRVAYLGLFANPVSKIGNHRTLYRTVLANARRAGGHPWHDP